MSKKKRTSNNLQPLLDCTQLVRGARRIAVGFEAAAGQELGLLAGCLNLLEPLLAVGNTIHQDLLLAEPQLAAQFLYLVLKQQSRGSITNMTRQKKIINS